MDVNKKITDNTKIMMILLEVKNVGKVAVYKIYKNLLKNKEFSLDNEKDIEKVIKAMIDVKPKTQIDTRLFSKYYEKIEGIIEKANEDGIKITSIADEDYPKRFKAMESTKINMPVILYSKGNLSPFETGKNVAIIGTRKPTEYGSKITKNISKMFTEEGWNVISGLALGCDKLAHEGCLEAGGKTLAILPSDVKNVYPRTNRKLAENILNNNGALISEYYKTTTINKGNYIERDKLQSAYAELIVVTSATMKTGTKYAIDTAEKLNKLICTYSPDKKYFNEDSFKYNKYLIEKCNALTINSDKNRVNKIINHFKYNLTQQV